MLEKLLRFIIELLPQNKRIGGLKNLLLGYYIELYINRRRVEVLTFGVNNPTKYVTGNNYSMLQEVAVINNLYISRIDNNTTFPITNSNYWVRLNGDNNLVGFDGNAILAGLLDYQKSTTLLGVEWFLNKCYNGQFNVQYKEIYIIRNAISNNYLDLNSRLNDSVGLTSSNDLAMDLDSINTTDITIIAKESIVTSGVSSGFSLLVARLLQPNIKYTILYQ